MVKSLDATVRCLHAKKKVVFNKLYLTTNIKFQHNRVFNSTFAETVSEFSKINNLIDESKPLRHHLHLDQCHTQLDTTDQLTGRPLYYCGSCFHSHHS